MNLRITLLKQGHDLPKFHATEDKQENRNAVTKLLASQNTWHWVAIVIEKSKVHPSIRNPHEFYLKHRLAVPELDVMKSGSTHYY